MVLTLVLEALIVICLELLKMISGVYLNFRIDITRVILYSIFFSFSPELSHLVNVE